MGKERLPGLGNGEAFEGRICQSNISKIISAKNEKRKLSWKKSHIAGTAQVRNW